LQGWGDLTDISQAVAMYFFAVGSVCIYCWIPNELSEQVGKVMLFIPDTFSSKALLVISPDLDS
jgi:hypothetical protein